MSEVPFDINSLTEKSKHDGIDQLVVGAMIEDKDKVLIVKRAAEEDFLPDIYEIPGGKVDENETIIQALQREIFEETVQNMGRVIKYLGYFDSTNHNQEN